jgi:hypothetical protein
MNLCALYFDRGALLGFFESDKTFPKETSNGGTQVPSFELLLLWFALVFSFDVF